MDSKKNNKKLMIIIAIVVVVIIAIVGVVVFMNNSNDKGGNGTETKNVEKMSKEEMIENATELSILSLNAYMKENSVRAKEEYQGKIYKYTGAIKTISDNNVVLNSQDNAEESITVYLSKEELKQFYTGQVINVVGELQINGSIKELKNAYFVSDSIDLVFKNVYIPIYMPDIRSYYLVLSNCWYRFLLLFR